MRKTYLELSDVLWETGAYLKLAKQSSRRASKFFQASKEIEQLGKSFWSLSEKELRKKENLTNEIVIAILEWQNNNEFILHKKYQNQFGKEFAYFLRLPGIGPSTALTIKSSLGLTDLNALEASITSKKLLQVKGIGKSLFGQLKKELPKLQTALQEREKAIDKLSKEQEKKKAFQTKQQISQKTIIDKTNEQRKQNQSRSEKRQNSDVSRLLKNNSTIDRFSSILCCPETKKSGFDLHRNEAICQIEDTRYPIVHGIIDMSSHSTKRITLLQYAKESELYHRAIDDIVRPSFMKFLTHKNRQQKAARSVVELRVNPDWVILDLSCRSGSYSRAIASQIEPNKGFVVGIDSRWSKLMRAIKLQKRSNLSNMHFIRACVENIPLKNESIDAIHCAEGLHSFRHIDLALREMHRVIKPGGRLVINTFLSSHSRFLRSLQEHSYPMIGFRRWFERRELISRLESFGFHILREKIDQCTITLTTECRKN